MGSKYLQSLSREKYDALNKKLYDIQTQQCYICQKVIDLDLQTTNIDHIIPLTLKGKDNESNFALTHESCNKSKLDSNLDIARRLHTLKNIQDKIHETENKAASLKHVLDFYGGSKYDFKYKVENDALVYSFSEMGNNEIFRNIIFNDALSNEKTSFIKVPLEYIFHDDNINPRGINRTISKLIKEFDKGNPQLHVCLARIHDNKIKIFDGQHKTVAQILLGTKDLLLRLFLEPDVDRLTETNTNAGSTLRQIAFDKSILRQLYNSLYLERLSKYQENHNLEPDDFSFSEEQLINHFKGEGVNIKKLIIENIKHSITYSPKNKFKDYIDFEGKAKELPISHSAYDKVFLNMFINSKLILNTNMDYKADEGNNPRTLEVNQLVQLLNMIAEELYIGKFIPEVGVYRIENKIVDGKDQDISDDHLAAFRMSKEEIMYNWLMYLKKAIEIYFDNTGKLYDDKKLFQEPFDEQIWTNIRNFLRNLSELPLWKDKSMASTIFAGKNTYDYWHSIFEKGENPDGANVLAKPLNYIELIKPNETEG